MLSAINTDVIIVGAGPSGLALACQLIRYGIDFVIFDKRDDITPYSKAIGVQARTLEIYEQIGLADKLIEMGSVTDHVRLLEGGKVRGEMSLAKLGQGMSPYPFLLIVEQSKHEGLLYDFIKTHNRDVLWERTLESFFQDEAGVTARISDVNGETQTIEAKYLVACDGAKSMIRNGLGLTFEGSTFERVYYVADVQINWQFPHDSLIACLARDRSTAFFPLPGENRYRIVGVFPEGYDKNERDILYEEVERQIVEDTGLDLDIYNVNWFSNYRVHSRHVNRFSEGRCFLVGDAAHIHAPAGAQGMNTGIQDGYNLAWKLALVVRGQASDKILESYNEERIEVARHLLETTDRIFDFLMSPAKFIAYFRTHIFPRIANFAMHRESVNQLFFPVLSQIGINYRDRSLGITNGKKSDVKAGDRMPWFEIDGESIYKTLQEPRFHFVTFTDHELYDAAATNHVRITLDDMVDFCEFPLNEHMSEVFGVKSGFSVLLRPDNYVAFITTNTSLDVLGDYLRDVIGYLR